MTCDSARTMLSGYLDNELLASEAMAVSSHLETCAACRQDYDALRPIGTAMRHHLPMLTAPDLLRSRVGAALRTAHAGRPAGRRRRAFWLRQIAAGLVIAVASSAVTRAVLRRAPSDSGIAVRDVVARHVRSLMTNHLTDIVSTDEHSVKPWFDGRVPFAPDVARLEDVGFPLAGGRVDTVGHEPTAALVYRRRKHVINVFTWPAHPGARASDEILSDTEHGYHVLRWTRGDMQFAAVSDLATIELREFVDAFRRSRSTARIEAEQPKR